MHNWLRPRVYVTDCGDFEALTPWADQPLVSTIPEGPLPCCECGRDVQDDAVWYGDPPDLKCYACGEAEFAARKSPTGFKKVRQDWGIRYDNLWFAYCQRFGKRVQV